MFGLSATDQRVARRVAERAVLPDEVPDKAPPLFPPSVRQLLRRAFTLRGLDFFTFYEVLWGINQGMPVPADLRQQFKKSADILARIKSPVDKRTLSPIAINMIAGVRSPLNTLLNRLLQGANDPMTWMRINELFVPLLLEVARDKQVFIKATQRGRERWVVRFRKMTPKQERIEKLRDDDPESYALMQQRGKALAEIDAGIRGTIERSGQKLVQGFLMGRPVLYGQDPVTGERMVYDRDGEVLSRDDYIAKRRAHAAQQAMLGREPSRTEVKLDDLRILSEEALEDLEGPIEYAALTDDLAKQGRLTRIFATRRKRHFVMDDSTGETRVEKVRVIIEGRYKGVYLDDMVNSQGRLIEGTAYTYSARDGRSRKVPQRIDPSQREPYITTADMLTEQRFGRKMVESKEQKLFLKIPGTKEYTDLRNTLKKFACNTGAKTGCIPSISYHPVEGSRAASFYFDPKDFALIMDTLKGLSLSKSALSEVKGYYADLARAEAATANENLTFYGADQIGGFKSHRKNRDTGEMDPVDFNALQKKAMAWLDANGNSGVCAMETGVGKCLVEDTLVTTNKGLIRIGDMNPGVLDPDTAVPVEGWSVLVDGKALPVQSFYYGGQRPTIKVRTRRGYEVEGSLVHPLLVRTPEGVETWVKTPELVAGDYLCIERKEAPFPADDPPLSVPLLDEIQQASRNPDVTFTHGALTEFPVPDRMTPEMGRLLGYIVGEGWTNSRKGFSVSQCPEKNPMVRADIEDLLQRLMGWTAKPKKDIQIQSVFLREYLTRMGVGMGVAKDKTVPDVVLQSSQETVRSFLRALIDAEGSVQPDESRSHIEFSTASEQLGREVQVLLLRFGIVCSRRPKMVKGYDHTYWRLTITGADAIRYQAKIGFISDRKKDAALRVPDTRNSNLDVVPHLAPAVGGLFTEMLAALDMNVSAFRRQVRDGSASFGSTVNHVRLGRRNPTFKLLREMLSLAADAGCQDSPHFKAIAAVVDRRFFYDPIEVMEESDAVVVDITVDDPSHCFVGNGVMNHNTLTAVGMMQKLVRDGLADEGASYSDTRGRTVTTNGRFLFVAPNKLKGNLPKEIREFLSDPRELLDRVDVISYREFSGSAQSGKVPRSIRSVPFWKKRRWDPKLYVSIIFDEAHKMNRMTSGRTQTALTLDHPRKICLTASPMEKDPMEAYILAAISGNKPLNNDTPEGSANRTEMRRFKERFCETLGGRIIGVKQDPQVKRDLDVWVKRNVFHADKTAVEEAELPPLTTQTVAVEMPEQAERAYRAVSQAMPRLMRGLVAKFRDRGEGEHRDVAQDPEIERIFGLAFAPIVQILNRLANQPDKAMLDIAEMLETGKLPGKDVAIPPVLRRTVAAWRERFDPAELRIASQVMGNPKLEATAEVLRHKLARTSGSTRTLLFSDDKGLCLAAVEHMSKTIGGRHALAMSDRIEIWGSGGPLTEYEVEIEPQEAETLIRRDPRRVKDPSATTSIHRLPLTQRAGRRHPALPAHDRLNIHYKAAEWSQFAFKELIGPDPFIKTVTLLGQQYQYGHNFQWADTVIHLDRDTWSNENMKQRTARSWRQGQDQPVDEITVDATYRSDSGNLDGMDATLDEVRKWFQQIEGELFDRIIRDAQGVELGAEWSEMLKRDSSLTRLDRKVFDLMLSPYARRSEVPGT